MPPYWPYAGDEFKPFRHSGRGGLASAAGTEKRALSYDDDDMRIGRFPLAIFKRPMPRPARRLPVAAPADEASAALFPGITPNQPPVRL